MIKRYLDYIKEDNLEDIEATEDKYINIKDDIKSMIETTIENSGGEINTFISSYIRNPDDYKIEGLINDSDIYDFYLKNRNDIDEILNDIKFFDEVPTDLNSFSLYDYVIKGTERAVEELVKGIN